MPVKWFIFIRVNVAISIRRMYTKPGLTYKLVEICASLIRRDTLCGWYKFIWIDCLTLGYLEP